MSTTEAPPVENKTEAKPDPKTGGKKGGSKPKAKPEAAEKPEAAKPEKVAREPKPGATTKRPANLAKSQHQPPKGKDVTDAMVKKGREEWGITPHVKLSEIEAVKPSTRGWIVHARTKGADKTLCGTNITWVGGAETVNDKGDINCLWCMCRVADIAK